MLTPDQNIPLGLALRAHGAPFFRQLEPPHHVWTPQQMIQRSLRRRRGFRKRMQRLVARANTSATQHQPSRPRTPEALLADAARRDIHNQTTPLPRRVGDHLADMSARRKLDESRQRRRHTTHFAGLGHQDPMSSPGVTPGARLFSDGPRFGINATKLDEVTDAGDPSDDFGSTTAQLADCASLGARSLRQFGHHDLLWGMLVPKGDYDGETNVPEPIGIGTFPDYGPSAQVLTTDNIDALSTLMLSSRAAGRRLVFTVLTLGGGTFELVRADTLPSRLTSVLELAWHKDHFHQTLNGFTFTAEGNSRYFDLHSLDLRNMYKVSWLAYFGVTLASLLSQAVQQAQHSDSRLKLGNVCRGIEIFNEIDIRNIELDENGDPDARRSAYYWARATEYVLCGLLMGAISEGWDDWPGVTLPGISSYDLVDPSSQNSWQYKISFFDSFLRALQSDMGDSLQQLAHTVDYHWYHGNDATDSSHTGRLHIAYLVHEVQEIQDVLADHGLDQIDVTVYECGASALDDAAPDHMDASLFQAQEVWRRVGGTLASGAQVAGWHSWMSRGGNNFAGMGLRVDTGGDDRKSQRPAWFSYQRLAETLEGLVSGRMVMPTTRSRADIARLDESGDLVLFEYHCVPALGRSEWVYLALIDPSGTTAQQDITITSPRGVTVTLRDTIATLASPVPEASDENLPETEASFAPDQTVALPTSLTVRRLHPPLLVISKQRLTWMRTPDLVDPSDITEPSWA